MRVLSESIGNGLIMCKVLEQSLLGHESIWNGDVGRSEDYTQTWLKGNFGHEPCSNFESDNPTLTCLQRARSHTIREPSRLHAVSSTPWQIVERESASLWTASISRKSRCGNNRRETLATKEWASGHGVEISLADDESIEEKRYGSNTQCQEQTYRRASSILMFCSFAYTQGWPAWYAARKDIGCQV